MLGVIDADGDLLAKNELLLVAALFVLVGGMRMVHVSLVDTENDRENEIEGVFEGRVADVERVDLDRDGLGGSEIVTVEV